jgi:hypothetical protein
LAEKTKTITFAERIAWKTACWKFSPGPISRIEIQQPIPRRSNASQIVLAKLRSFEEKLMKTILSIMNYHRATAGRCSTVRSLHDDPKQYGEARVGAGSLRRSASSAHSGTC